MKITEDTKLDYSDVLIRPKRSILGSRKEVNLTRKFQFPCGRIWTGVPIVAANMDTTGTIEMGKVLSSHNMLTCLTTKCKRTKQYGTFLRSSRQGNAT